METESVIASAYRKYFSITGRSSRPEYFIFLAYVVGVTATIILIENAFLSRSALGHFAPSAIFFFANLIPLVTVFVRRLHDADEDIPLLMVPIWCLLLGGIGLMAQFGYEVLFGLFFVPFGQLLCFQVLKDPGTTGANRFGADPSVADNQSWNDSMPVRAVAKDIYRVRR
jgi:uncharacterized membrane protein YhaH (DUF805 family)